MKKLIFSLLAAAALFVSFAFGKSHIFGNVKRPDGTAFL